MGKVSYLYGKFLIGVIIYQNKDKCEGEFENNNITGKGTLTSVDGSIYTGEFMEAKKHGKGILFV